MRSTWLKLLFSLNVYKFDLISITVKMDSHFGILVPGQLLQAKEQGETST